MATRQDDQPSGQIVMPPAKDFPQVSDLAPDAEITGKQFASLSYGIQVFLWWDGTYRTWDLDNVRQLNFAYVKQNFSWKNIQPTEDLWDWSIADEVVAEIAYRGRRIVARIDGAPDWAIREPEDWEDPPYDIDALTTYCRTLAERYTGQIEAYQIWNEPNLAREWAEEVPSPPGYVTLLEACGGAIREVDPNAIIISAGLAPTGSRDETVMPDVEYYWRLYESGFAEHFDVLGVHAPGYGLPPHVSAQQVADLDRPTWARFRHVEDIRAIMVANGDAHKQIAILEMGWTTDTRPDSSYTWMGVTEKQQGHYLAEGYTYAAKHWRPWVGLVNTIYMASPSWTAEDEEWWWAVNEPIGPPYWTEMRPAYFAIANMEKYSTNPDFAEAKRDPNGGFYLEPLPARN